MRAARKREVEGCKHRGVVKHLGEQWLSNHRTIHDRRIRTKCMSTVRTACQSSEPGMNSMHNVRIETWHMQLGIFQFLYTAAVCALHGVLLIW